MQYLLYTMSTKETQPLPRALQWRGIERAWNLLLDIVYPPRCGGCSKRGTLLCPRCLASIVIPDLTDHDIPHIDAFICSGVFGGRLREAIHRLKYESDTPLARPLAALIAIALEYNDRWVAEDGEAPALVPVPLHLSKQRSRVYNQSELLSRELSRITGWQVQQGLVRKGHKVPGGSRR